MASDAREFNPTGAAPQDDAQAAEAAAFPADAYPADALNAMGYEAADPALHAPLWAEAVDAGPTRRSLR